MSQTNREDLSQSSKLFELPAKGYLRLNQIVGDADKTPPILPLIPIGKSTWWRWVAEGKAPKGRKLGSKIRVWTHGEIQVLLDNLALEQEG
jgi:predicted DNA-binding transcriptional regulator AlpA